MHLFAVNRYDNEHQEGQDGSQENENDKLKRLMKKVAKRKRKLEQENEQVEEIREEDVSERKVKRKLPEENESAKEVVEQEQSVTEERSEERNESAKSGGNFQVLGTDTFAKKAEAKMVLPGWLTHPTIVVSEIATGSVDIDELGSIISPNLVQNLKANDITKLFPIQKEVIPWILDAHDKPPPLRPRDICVSAPTGSGKTLAFALPIVQLLLKRVELKTRALVVLPATELALQVFKVFKTLTRNTQVKVTLLSTTNPFKKEQKYIVNKIKDKYYPKFDIVVTTPGRLVEHLHATEGFELKSLRFLVVDEADRIMEQGHHNWLYHLDEHLKTSAESFMVGRSVPLCLHLLETEALKRPHKMLFSATLTQDPEKLENLRLFQPKLFTSIVRSTEELADQLVANRPTATVANTHTSGDFIGKFTTPAELSEYCIHTELRLKPLTLFVLLNKNNWKRFLCFTNSTQASNRLSFVLQHLYTGGKKKVADLSSALKPAVRKKVIEDFSKGEIDGLICSDALARGIDIEKVDVVISYEVPRHINTYIHRVGRTARAGNPGTAVTIVTETEIDQFNKMLSIAGKSPLPELKTNPDQEEKFAHAYSKALEALQVSLQLKKDMKAVRSKHVKNRSQLANGENQSVMNRLQAEIVEKIDKNEIKPTKARKQSSKNE